MRRGSELPGDQNRLSEVSSSYAPMTLELQLALERYPDSEIRLEDGNIVIESQGTAFRIYRGLISGQSTMFSAMVAPSNSIPSETFDESLVVNDLDHGSTYDLV